MHINMKYYIVTIGAIFIALGIGILVGYNLNYDQELSKQQATMIEDLDIRFENLKKKNNDLELDLEKATKDYNELVEFLNENYNLITKDLLLDKNIGIISTTTSYDYIEDVTETLNNASANIGFDIIINDSIKDKIEELNNLLQKEFKTEQEVVNYVIEELSNENMEQTLNQLQELGIIKINSLDPKYKEVNSVILAGGKDNPKDDGAKYQVVDKEIIKLLKEKNMYLVGVEKSDVKYSYIDKYKEDKITSINNINEGSGKTSLILSLKDNIKGNFGNGKNVDGLIPTK